MTSPIWVSFSWLTDRVRIAIPTGLPWRSQTPLVRKTGLTWADCLWYALMFQEFSLFTILYREADTEILMGLEAREKVHSISKAKTGFRIDLLKEVWVAGCPGGGRLLQENPVIVPTASFPKWLQGLPNILVGVLRYVCWGSDDVIWLEVKEQKATWEIRFNSRGGRFQSRSYDTNCWRFTTWPLVIPATLSLFFVWGREDSRGNSRL